MQDSGRATILLVDDIGQLPEAERNVFTRKEIRLLTTRPGPEALNLAQREPVDLIFVGLDSNERRGVELCKNLKSLPMTEDIPVILVTTSSGRAEAEQARADAILCTPYRESQLLNTVQRFIPLEKRRHNRFPVNLRFTFEFDRRVGQAFSRVLSYSGAFLKTDRPVPVGTRLDLRFRLPGEEEEIHCSGVVRSTQDWSPDSEQVPGFGVEFEDMIPSDRGRLDSFVESLRRGRVSYRYR